MLEEFSAEQESEIDARRQERAFDYNYNAIADLLKKMEERRHSENGRSEVETG